MAELKPCPFCGGEAVVYGRVFYYILCKSCGVETKGSHSEQSVIEAWNRRTVEQANSGTDLSGKCGSCQWAEKIEKCYGSSNCYIRCTNPEKQHRMYYGRPVSMIKQRTAKACKKYLQREN